MLPSRITFAPGQMSLFDNDIMADGGPVVHPSHYNSHPSGVECMDLIRGADSRVANAVKHLFRCMEKHDDPTIDLKKTIYYLRDIEEYGIDRPVYSPLFMSRRDAVDKFSDYITTDIDELIVDILDGLDNLRGIQDPSPLIDKALVLV